MSVEAPTKVANRIALTGNDAAATALMHVNPDVAAIYPITPQTEMMHKFAEFAANGKVDTEVILVESEHSAMSACIGSSAAGARTITATSSCGLALMWEVLYVAASCRRPIVMPTVNRALSAPINIHCDHSDTMGARDTGWIQIYSENAQEAYDNVIQAFRIAEHKDVQLPVMVTLDGFILSHTVEALEILDRDTVQEFVGEYKPERTLLDVENPYTIGPLALPNYYYEVKRQQVEAMRNAFGVIEEVGRAYGQLSGRSYEFFEEYRLDDAEVALVALGSTNGTIKAAVDEMRDSGVKAGLLKLRVFRPFPDKQIMAAIAHVPTIGVMDRCVSFGLEGGPVFHEIRSAAYGRDMQLVPFIYGLGGRDIGTDEIREVFQTLQTVKASGERKRPVEFVGLRE